MAFPFLYRNSPSPKSDRSLWLKSCRTGDREYSRGGSLGSKSLFLNI